jgi:poly(A) polymerase
MQPRFERRTGKTPYKLLEHTRFRAGYDFLLLRCASGEIDSAIGEWWTAFIEGDGEGREQLLAQKPRPEDSAGGAAKRPKRRSGRGRAKPSESGAEGGDRTIPDQSGSGGSQE